MQQQQQGWRQPLTAATATAAQPPLIALAERRQRLRLLSQSGSRRSVAINEFDVNSTHLFIHRRCINMQQRLTHPPPDQPTDERTVVGGGSVCRQPAAAAATARRERESRASYEWIAPRSAAMLCYCWWRGRRLMSLATDDDDCLKAVFIVCCWWMKRQRQGNSPYYYQRAKGRSNGSSTQIIHHVRRSKKRSVVSLSFAVIEQVDVVLRIVYVLCSPWLRGWSSSRTWHVWLAGVFSQSTHY